MGWWTKIREVKDKVKIAGAVSKIVLGGNQPKALNKFDKGIEIADKAFEIKEMVEAILKNK